MVTGPKPIQESQVYDKVCYNLAQWPKKFRQHFPTVLHARLFPMKSNIHGPHYENGAQRKTYEETPPNLFSAYARIIVAIQSYTMQFSNCPTWTIQNFIHISLTFTSNSKIYITWINLLLLQDAPRNDIIKLLACISLIRITF